MILINLRSLITPLLKSNHSIQIHSLSPFCFSFVTLMHTHKYLTFFWTCCSNNQGALGAAKFIASLVKHANEIVAIDARYNLMPMESLSVISSGLKDSKGGYLHTFSLLYQEIWEPLFIFFTQYFHLQENWSIWTWQGTLSVIKLLMQILFRLNSKSMDNLPLMFYCRLFHMYHTTMILSCITGALLDSQVFFCFSRSGSGPIWLCFQACRQPVYIQSCTDYIFVFWYIILLYLQN